MTRFQCVPIPTDTATRFRCTGLDDRSNQLRRMTATEGGAFPCRHCLQMGRPGEVMLLGSYDLPRPLGIYWTPSPIFIHERDCSRFGSSDGIAPIVRENPLVSIRAYDAADQCLYDLGHVCAGRDIATALERALNDPRTAFVNIHTARPGCLLAMVQPVRAG